MNHNIYDRGKKSKYVLWCASYLKLEKSKENYSIYQRVNTFYFDNRRQETYIRWHFISIVNFSTPWKQLDPQPHQSELGITSRKWSFVIHPLRSKNPKVLLPIPNSENSLGSYNFDQSNSKSRTIVTTSVSLCEGGFSVWGRVYGRFSSLLC